MRTLEVVALVYRSVAYSRFITDQLSRYARADGWDVSVRVVANDPEVDEGLLLEVPRAAGFLTSTYGDPCPESYYLNRVYRCWNWSVATSRAENVCLVNSDMAFSPGWLDALLRRHDGKTTPTSRLVESGKLRSGLHGVEKDFGRDPRSFREPAWLAYAASLRDEGRVEAGGLFMPVVFDRDEFVASGGYPEGNLYRDGVGTRTGPVVRSGDAYFFEKLRVLGRPHATCFDSLVYHFQEGESSE